MTNQLDFDKAMFQASKLKNIPGCPWDEGATVANAQYLQRWCQGAFEGGYFLSAEDQADWLVNEAQLRMTDLEANPSGKWLGPGALLRIFRGRFEKPKPDTAPGIGYEEAVARGLCAAPCSVCDDKLTIGNPPNVAYCTACSAGRHQKKWYGDRGLEAINRPPPERRASEGGLQRFTPITEATMRAALEDEQCRKREQAKRVEAFSRSEKWGFE